MVRFQSKRGHIMATRKDADLPRSPGVGSPPAAAPSLVGGIGSTRISTHQSAPDVEPETRHEMIARAAYLHAQERGFAAGHELDDWLSAEAEVDRALAMREPAPTQQRGHGMQ
jgi:hypothetical protein